MALREDQLLEFKERLLKLRAQISKALKGTTQEVVEPDQSKGYSQHQADEGTDDFVKNINLEISSTETQLLRQIDRALEKIEQGTYTICDCCGKEIAIERLYALPYATMTVKCQEEIEKKHI